VFIEFHPTCFFVKDIKTRKLLLQGPSRGGLYPWSSHVPHTRSPLALLGERVSLNKWHSRLGHPALRVVRRVLAFHKLPVTPRKAEDEDDQRHNLFHSWCTIGGKVCQLVIDSGNCENVVAEEVVDKLALETKKHPKPYRLEWLKKGNEVIVSKRCLVSFSIGSRYKDKMWCDIVAMDACHLLLGRPWQYDRGAHHDGRKNTYSFMFDRVRITLLPNGGNSSKPTKGAGHSQSLLTRREFITEMLASKVVYVLVCKDSCKGDEVPNTKST
jgi:hypothetical protein